MGKTKKIPRVIIGKVGLDTHDRGIIVLTRILREAGFEVIFLGRFQTAEGVVLSARDEGADVIALSDHCGVMVDIVKDVRAMMEKCKIQDIPLVAGGFIEEKDFQTLKEMGVTAVFTPKDSPEAIIDHFSKITARNNG